MKNALVFDDNKILSELIQMKVEALFKKYGLEFQVDRMNSLAQLEACDKTYQLAFMDIVLPEQDVLGNFLTKYFRMNLARNIWH